MNSYLFLSVVLALFLFSSLALAQVQSHPLSQLNPIDVNLNLTGVNITNVSYIFFGNNSVDTYLYRSAASVLTLNSHLIVSGGWVNSTYLNASTSVNTSILCLAGICKSTWPSGAVVGGSGTSTQVAFWSASDTLNSSSNLYWDNSNNRLGIGTSSPTETLSVVGSANISSWLNTSALNISGTKNVSINSPTFFIDTTNSNVGIGTTTPGNYKLNVIGDINASWGNFTNVNISSTFNAPNVVSAGGWMNASNLNASNNIYGSNVISYGWVNSTSINVTNIYISDDLQLFRGGSNRLDLASGDSFNLVSGSLLIGGNTVIDSSRNIIGTTWINATNFNASDTIRGTSYLVGTTTVIDSSRNVIAGTWVNGTNLNASSTIYATEVIPSALTLGWQNLTDYPAACPSGQAVQQLGDTIVCATAGGGWTVSGVYLYNDTAAALVGIGVLSPITKLEVAANDTNVGALTEVLTISHFISNATNGTANIASGILFRSEDALGNIENISLISSPLTTATNGSEAGALTFFTRTGGGELTERMRIDSSGSVGIGTTNPGSAKLNITNGNLSIKGTNTGILFPDGSYQIQSETNVSQLYGYNGSWIGLNVTRDGILRLSVEQALATNADTLDNLDSTFFAPLNTTYYAARINATDWINSSVMQVTTLNLGWANLTNYPGACDSGQFVTTVGDTLTCTSAVTVNNMTGYGTAGYIPQWFNTTALNNSNIFQLGSNVGIGTASPASVLHIYGVSGAAGAGKIRLDTGSTNENARNWEIRTETTTGQFSLFQSAEQGGVPLSGTERLSINVNGNVGIGDTTPTQKLTIAGNTSISSGSALCWDGETCSRYTYYNGTCIITQGATSKLEVC